MKKTINDATKNLSKYTAFQLKRAFTATDMPDTYDGVLSRYLMIISAKLEEYKRNN